MRPSIQTDVFHPGDTLQTLKKFPSNTIRCVVTSPPYYGLRDYGTSTWTGGNINCDHSTATNVISDATRSSTLQGGKNNQIKSHEGRKVSKSICKKCGATRIDMQLGLEKTPELYIKAISILSSQFHKMTNLHSKRYVIVLAKYTAIDEYRKYKQQIGQTTTSISMHFSKSDIASLIKA